MRHQCVQRALGFTSSSVLLGLQIARCDAGHLGGNGHARQRSVTLSLSPLTRGECLGLFPGHTEHLAEGFEGTTSSAGDVAYSIYVGMFAFSGWWVNISCYSSIPQCSPLLSLQRSLTTNYVEELVDPAR